MLQQNTVFDDKSLRESSIKMSPSIDPDFGVLPRKSTEKIDYQGTLTASAKGHNKQALEIVNNFFVPLEITLISWDKLLSKNYQKATTTCKDASLN